MPPLPEYADPLEYRRVLRDLGYKDLESVMSSYLESVPVSLAQRGDLGIFLLEGQVQCAVVNVGDRWIGKAESGLVSLSSSQIEKAFRV